METKPKMVAEARLFVRLGLLSFLGFVFYYAHLFFGLLDNVVVFKALAITFLLATVPLPIIAVNNKKLFPELPSLLDDLHLCDVPQGWRHVLIRCWSGGDPFAESDRSTFRPIRSAYDRS